MDISGLSSLMNTTGFSTTMADTTDFTTGTTAVMPTRRDAIGSTVLAPSAYPARSIPTVAYRAAGFGGAYPTRFPTRLVSRPPSTARVPDVPPMPVSAPLPPVQPVEQPAVEEIQRASPRSPRSPIRSPPFYSPPGSEAATEQSTPSSDGSGPLARTYYIWYVCALVAFPLALPAGLAILPLLQASKAAPIGTAVQEPPTQSTLSTDAFWDGFDLGCLKSVVLKDNIQDISRGDVNRVQGNIPYPRFFICCLYNNTRFRKPHHWDYLPKHIPFDLCPCVVYWSVGIESGKLVSRVPEFDRVYGLKQLRNLKKSWSKILMTVGGFAEESYQFSRLGWDQRLMAVFVTDVLDALIDFGLDGINIHWEFPGGHCGRPEDLDVLINIVTRLRDIFRLNGKPFYITAMIRGDFDIDDRYDLPKLAPNVDYLFFETHTLAFRRVEPRKACTRNDGYIISFYSASPPAVQQRMCFSATAATWAQKAIVQPSNGGYNVQRMRPSDPLPVSRILGQAAWFEVCNVPYYTFPLGNTGCNVIISKAANLGEHDLHIYEATRSYKKKFQVMSCALVYDIDFDVYRGGCPAHLAVYSAIKYVWAAASSVPQSPVKPSP